MVDQRVKTTNLPWVIDAAVVAKEFRIERVTLLNDLVAVGLGAIAAGPSKLRSIHVGAPRKTGGNLAVIAAGTGLGEASFVWDGTTHVACPTEGSHVDFAPRTPVEIDLWKLLAREYGHVSYERVASGSTIAVLYTFFVRDQRVPESEAAASYVARAKDQNVAVVDLAEKGTSEAAMRAVELWCSVYGAEAGNLALKSLSTAGLYVCGGASARRCPRRGTARPAQGWQEEERRARRKGDRESEPVPRGLRRQGTHAAAAREDPDRGVHRVARGPVRGRRTRRQGGRVRRPRSRHRSARPSARPHDRSRKGPENRLKKGLLRLCSASGDRVSFGGR